MREAEAVVERLVKEDVCTGAAGKFIPADPFASVLFSLGKRAVIARAGIFQHLCLQGGSGKRLFIKIRRYMPGQPGKTRAAGKDCSQA